jgi:SP family myo-inositol transporter-like MFS transporter 13
MSLDNKSDLSDGPIKDNVEEIEQVDTISYKNQTDLSSIEATAASTAAWLISIVVSIGGLLFGML